MTARCEPPEHLRGVDGWHWLSYPDAPGEPAHWQASNQSWLLSGHDDYVTRDFMRLDEVSTRYLSPVAPPAVSRREDLAENHTQPVERYANR